MNYNVSFRTEDREGHRIYSWFVFDDDGNTLQDGFSSKELALAWAMRTHGWKN